MATVYIGFWSTSMEEDANLRLFCQRCGTLITISAKGAIRCALCMREYDASLLQHFERTVNLEEREKEKQDEMAPEIVTRTMIGERCPECQHEGVYFSTAQLRSADEGQTIFYECPKCGCKWNQNA